MKLSLLLLITLISLPILINSRRIAGGYEASRGSFPWHALVESSDGILRRLCGGALVKYNWILTAAQCIDGSRDVIVRLGIVDRLRIQEGISFLVRNQRDLIVHQNYSGDYENSIYENDIGLIYIQSATESILSTYINTVALPLNDNLDIVGKTGYATGFGFHYDDDDPLQLMRLHSVDMPVIDLYSCKQAHGSSVVTNGHICTNTAGGRSTCIGDEGAPLIILDREPTIIGIGSVPLQICTQGYPAIFTNILPHLDWIRGYIDG